MATEHPPALRPDDWQALWIAAVIYEVILLLLLKSARRDRKRDRSLAVVGLLFSLFPFLGAAAGAVLSLWLSYDLRKVEENEKV